MLRSPRNRPRGNQASTNTPPACIPTSLPLRADHGSFSKKANNEHPASGAPGGSAKRRAHDSKQPHFSQLSLYFIPTLFPHSSDKEVFSKSLRIERRQKGSTGTCEVRRARKSLSKRTYCSPNRCALSFAKLKILPHTSFSFSSLMKFIAPVFTAKRFWLEPSLKLIISTC